jgi:hypothetical protein
MTDTNQISHRPKLQVAAEIAVIVTGLIALSGVIMAVIQWLSGA